MEEERNMSPKKWGATLVAALAVVVTSQAAFAKGELVGVSWSNFQEERWKKDEAAIKAALEAAGAKYISADAQGSNEKQLADVEALIAKGAKALIILAQDASAVLPAVNKAKEAKIPVVAYDRLIQDASVLYVTFDNVEVGRLQARAVLAAKPKGNYVLIKGSPTDPNADMLANGQRDVLADAIYKKDVKIVGEQYTEGWSPEAAQKNMEQILTKNNNKVDAVVASNDGTAGAAIAALRAQNMVGVPVSGQDADVAALNRVAKGEQTVTVWKDARELGKVAGAYAAQIAAGGKRGDVKDVRMWSGGSKKVQIPSVFLKPVAITRDNLDVVITAGWVTKAQVCAGVEAAKAPPACK
ncbi:D-xylose ABC transporter substrate-binding protein [Betaproteobacteria bacterium GR16-43]|nr:D-xylose ABC transporter substrate-binding protein [Betaproteobacteria bacterium GR16-43]